jgi:hypothetical protein
VRANADVPLHDLQRANEATARTGLHYVGLHRLRPVRPVLALGEVGFTWTIALHAMPVAVTMPAICIGSATVATHARQ